MQSPETITVQEAAHRLGINPVTLETALIDDAENHTNRITYGQAFRCLSKKKWRYVIVKSRFESYMRASDLQVSEQQASEQLARAFA